MKEKSTNGIAGSKMKEYIRYYSIHLFIVELWPEEDVEYFHQRAKDAVSVLNATGSFTSKVNSKMVLYYTFLLTNTIKKARAFAFTGDTNQ